VARKITVIQMLPDMQSGGVESVTLETAAYLVKHGHRSMVISAGGAMADQLQREGSHHLTWPHIGEKSPRCLTYILPLATLLVTQRVDILHLRSRLPAWIGYMAWKHAQGRSATRLVTTFHGFYSVNAYSRIMTKGEMVIAISQAIAHHLKTVYRLDDSRMAIIPEGIDIGRFSPDSVSVERVSSLKRLWGIETADQPIIMLPARITRLKGHDRFIQALSAIRHLNWQALCVGAWDRGSSYQGELLKLAHQTGLDGRVMFAGECADMPAAYMLADVVISASKEPESFGRVAVEAQAMGKMVVATAHGGSLETVLAGQGGILAQPNQVDSMAAAIKEALARIPLSRHQVEATRLWIADRFSLERMGRDTLDLYLRMCRLAGAAPSR